VLGDSVTRGPDPVAVLVTLRQRRACLIRGNVETYLLQYRDGTAPAHWYGNRQWAALAWTAQCLDDEGAAFLAQLPEQRRLSIDGAPPVLLVHGSPDDPAESLYVARDPAVVALFAQAGLLLPDRLPRPVEEVLPTVQEDVLLCGHTHLPWIYRDGEKLALNPGSVGMSVAGDPRARYAWLDLVADGWQPTLRAIAYDLAALESRFHESGALSHGGALADAFMRTMLTGHNAIMAFLRQAAQRVAASREADDADVK
jgi:predicted phosphodiesterase